MIDKNYLEEYIQKAQQLSAAAAQQPNKKEELIRLIESSLKEAEGNPGYEQLFKGELDFAKGNYEIALMHYLQAGSVPNFSFYCYRASAYVSKTRGHIDKAINFAKKALNIYPNDYRSLALYEELLTLSVRREEAQQIRTKIKSLEVGLDTETFEGSYPFVSISTAEQTETDQSATDTQPENQLEKPMESHESISTPISSLEKKTPIKLADVRIEEPPSDFLKEFMPEVKPEEQERSLAAELGVEDKATQALEQRVRHFQKKQGEYLQQYMEQAKKRAKLSDHFLYVLQGWGRTENLTEEHLRRLYLSDSARKSTGGYFIRWSGKGIVINPGVGFLKAFHSKGMHIRDIDFVIVTGEDPNSYADVKEIYDLNYQLNKASSELQIIHYYLNAKAYQDLSRVLKPNFKQERNTIVSLEIFLDSPDVEKTELHEGITLNYFVASTRDNTYSSSLKDDLGERGVSNLGIKLELRSPHEKGVFRLGYISGAPWSPLLSHHLGVCDLLITGFGNTSVNDFQRLQYSQDSLGYYGSISLLEEVTPKIMLCGEFGGREGDIRLEIVQKLRHDYNRNLKTSKANPVVLPADRGLYIDLKTLYVRCTVGNTLVEPQHVHVVKTAEAFGSLLYLSPSCSY